MDSQSIREINCFFTHSWPFLPFPGFFCVGERCGDHFWCLNWDSRVCVFLKQQRRRSFQAFCLLLLLLLCSSPPRKEVFPGYFWSVVVDVFFVFCLKVSLMKLHVLNPWSWILICMLGTFYCRNCGWWVFVGFGLSTYLASFFGGFLLPLLAYCVLSLSLLFLHSLSYSRNTSAVCWFSCTSEV